jgi:phospholipid transport system substrate-binding protein
MKLWKSLISTWIIIGFLSSGLVYAETELVEPQRIIKQASDDMIKALKDNQQKLKDNPDEIYCLVETILIPHFDFEKMSKLVLGKNWRNATPSQRQQFTEEFRYLLVRTYSTAMTQYVDKEIDFLPFRGDLKKKKAKVEMEIVQTGGSGIPMTLAVYQNKQDQWKAYDVKIDGISLVTNYRSSFASEIRKDGMDGLIKRLAEKNQKAKS